MLDQVPQTRQSLLQILNLGAQRTIFLLYFLVQALDGGECYAVRINRSDAALIFADAKGSVEILRDGPDVADRFVLGFVVPSGRGQGGEFVEDLTRVCAGKVRFGVAVAERGPGTSTRRKFNTRGCVLVSEEPDATGGANPGAVVERLRAPSRGEM